MMTIFWKILYDIVLVPLLWSGFQIMRLFSSKVRKGARGRRDVFARLRAYTESHDAVTRAWVHASSMGEFEQAKPIIEMLREEYPDIQIIASFFSPSGYENNLRYAYADHITYIPIDTARSARRFIALIRPSVAVIIRYDIWPNHVWACHRTGVPIFLVNATMRARSLRLMPGMRAFHRALFNCMRAILTVSESDAGGFARLHLAGPEIVAAGDTRYDRVMGRTRTAHLRPLIPDAVRRDRPVIVFGSSWSEDEDVLLPVLFKLLEQKVRALFVIVPHEPTIPHLETLEYRMRGTVRTLRFSYIQQYADEDVLVVDSVGNLLSLYASADIAFVGGGFKSNVHNTLEPAAYGIPVLFGPKIENSQEARELIESGGAIMVRNRQELYRYLRTLLSDEALRQSMGARAGEFVHSRAGSTAVIVGRLGEFLG